MSSPMMSRRVAMAQAMAGGNRSASSTTSYDSLARVNSAQVAKKAPPPPPPVNRAKKPPPPPVPARRANLGY